jgi:hypothetical protein
MKQQQLTEMWSEDSKLDASNLTSEAQRVYDLHAKYLDLLMKERMIWKALKLEKDNLELSKHEFLLQGPSKETKEQGWVYPTSGKIIRNDIELYRNADKQVQELDWKLESSKVKLDALGYIMEAIKNRTFVINKLIDREKFLAGV